MRFLTAPRTPEERTAIKARLLACTCHEEDDPDSDSEHRAPRMPAPTSPTFYYEKAMLNICLVLYGALDPLCPGQFRKRKKDVAKVDQPWPSDVHDLFPAGRGCADAIYSLMGWAENGSGGCGPFIAIAALITYWEPFGREVLRQPVVMASAARKLMIGYAEYLKSSDPDHHLFTWPIYACADRFMHSLRRFHPAEALSAMLPSYPELYLVSARITPILDANPILGSKFTQARYWFDALIDFQPVFILACENPNMVIRLEGTEGHEAALAGMMQLRNNNRCMNVDCQAPLGTRTSPCVRCAIVRYCGKECQRIAWKAAIAPHQPLCKLIHILREKLGLLDADKWDSWVLHDAPNRTDEHNWRNFSSFCESYNLDLALSETVDGQIKALEASRKGPLQANERFRW
ncbi:hypothetical protein B0H17DRAFT_1214124 [Mycena rosella]|uniref:MYND-type domain-containing protein n=1 Tax=Mycena rosella TaxID=1033263 RepID=A0AAD7G1A6_MYCRO|nr:hypothetical protein B0H17DRAFT_1214124 [Mycena rosella]